MVTNNEASLDTDESKQRLWWVDCLKGLAILLCIFGHVINGYMVADIFPKYTGIFRIVYDFIYAFHMPLFFLFSGYLYKLTWGRNKIKELKTKIKYKFIDMSIMYVVFSIVFCGTKYFAKIQMSTHFTASDLLLIWIKPLSYLWFLYVLMILYIFVPLLFYRIDGKRLLIGSLIISVIAKSGALELGVFNTVLYEAFYFIFGAWIYEYKNNVAKTILPMLFVVGLFVVIGNCCNYYYLWIYNSTLKTILVALSAIYILWYFFVCLLGPNFSAFLIFCGKNCLSLYILHLYFTGPSRTILRILGVENVYVHCLLGTIAGVLGPLVIIGMLKKYDVLYWPFEPMKMLKKYKFVE